MLERLSLLLGTLLEVLLLRRRLSGIRALRKTLEELRLLRVLWSLLLLLVVLGEEGVGVGVRGRLRRRVGRVVGAVGERHGLLGRVLPVFGKSVVILAHVSVDVQGCWLMVVLDIAITALRRC